VNEVPIGGGPVTILASGQHNPDSVAVDGAHVYWANQDGTVNEVPLGGGTAHTVAHGQGYPSMLAVLGVAVGP
jgi:sugar lactone lactonase YvrE